MKAKMMKPAKDQKDQKKGIKEYQKKTKEYKLLKKRCIMRNLKSLPFKMMNVVLGILFIAFACFLMYEFLFKFFKFVIGLILLFIGLQFLWKAK